LNFKSRKPEEEELTLNVTALTDVAFLIIIFFMFSTHFHRTQLRPMDLPREGGVEAQGSASPLIIEVDSSGQFSLTGSGQVDLARIIAEARPLGNASRPEVVIRADRRTPALHLNRLSTELARAGVRDWKLATAPGG
jgi:biopolymer transport protein ExbD